MSNIVVPQLGESVVEARIARVVATRWSLHRLERQQPTLENVFLRYVTQSGQQHKEAA